MSTIIAPEETFLDNGKYDKFLEEVKNSFSIFLKEFNEYSKEIHELTNWVKRDFNAKNYSAISITLDQYSQKLSALPSFAWAKNSIEKLSVASNNYDEMELSKALNMLNSSWGAKNGFGKLTIGNLRVQCKLLLSDLFKEINELYTKQVELSKKLENVFTTKNYPVALDLLKNNKERLEHIHSYRFVTKEIERLTLWTQMRKQFLFWIRQQITVVLDQAMRDKNENVVSMLKWLKKHPKLADRRKVLKGHERTIFSTQQQLCSHLSNDQAHELYKWIINQIKLAESKSQRISQI